MPDEIVQKIALDGDAEVLNKLRELGGDGAEVLTQLWEAAEKGANSFEVMGNAVGIFGTALVGVIQTLVSYIEANDDAIQKTNFLATAFGATTQQIAGIEAAFAQAGVSTKNFENFAQRLTTTIAREWPQIAAAAREGAVAQDQANEQVKASIISVQEARQNLARVDAETASRVNNAALSEEQAYLKLRNAAADAYSTMVRDANSVTGANLSLEAAQQRLNELNGQPPSDAEKQSLQLRQAQLAVDNARQAASDVLRKQQQDNAERSLKLQKAEQEASDASLKHETAIQDALNAHAKAEIQVQEKITARALAEEKAAEVSFRDIPKIASLLQGLAAGNKDVAKSFDFAQVSTQNFVKSVVLAAAEGNKLPPTGLKVMEELMKVFKNDVDKTIDAQQRLAIVQSLSQRGFNTTGSAAFELLRALERGPDFFKKFQAAQEDSFKITDKAVHNVEEFKDALELLGSSIDRVNRYLAAAASPTFTHFLEAVNESLTKNDGTLHRFVDGIVAIGTAIGVAVSAFSKFLEAVDKAFDVEKGTTLQRLIITMVAAVGLFANAWLGIPALITAVVVALGYVSQHMKEINDWIEKHRTAFSLIVGVVTAVVVALAPIPVAIAAATYAVAELILNWDKVTEAIKKAWENGSSGIGWLDKALQIVKTMWEVVSKIASVLGGLFGGDNPKGPSGQGTQAAVEGSSSLPGLAGGGMMRGPGSGTSDSMVIRVSNGEFVNKAASVAKYGVDFFHALNNMTLPAFATGGLVNAGASRVPASLSSANGQRPLSLTIDGRTFPGLRGPTNVVNDLQNFAVARQTTAAGRQPSWMK